MMEDSSDDENILKDMGFSNTIIGQIKKKSRLKNIFSSLPSCTSERLKIDANLQPASLEVSAQLSCKDFGLQPKSNCVVTQVQEQSLITPPPQVQLLPTTPDHPEIEPQSQPAYLEHSPHISTSHQPQLNFGDTLTDSQSQITSLSVQFQPTTSDRPEIEPQSQPAYLELSPHISTSHQPQLNFGDTLTDSQSQITSLSVQFQPTTSDHPEIEPQSQLEYLELSPHPSTPHQPQLNFGDTLTDPQSQITSLAVQSLPITPNCPEIEPLPWFQDVAIATNVQTDTPSQPVVSSSADLTGLLETSSSEPRRGRKRDIEKVKRMNGESFLGFRKEEDKWIQDIERGKREMGPRCTSDACLKGGLNCRDITEEDRKKNFESFWAEMDWTSKKVFVKSMVDVKEPKRRQKGNSSRNSRKGSTKTYHLKVKGQRIRVCRIFFLNSLGIKEWTVRYWLDPNANKSNEDLPASHLSASNNNATNDESSPPSKRHRATTKRQTVIDFIDIMPKVPSHYCRKTTSKLYLEPIIHSVNHLYELYKDYYKENEENTEIVSKRTFDRVLDGMNIGIFQPKKDMCDTCSKYKVGNLTKEAYEKHIKEKEKAREMKNKDKDRAMKGECYCFTVDLQSVKLAPNLRTSSMYYKTKLCVYNYTVYNLADNKARCYWFTEVDTDLTASTFASCLVDILSEYIIEKPLPIIVYSDGCTYQNRNAIIANALLDLSIKTNVVIEQKYLIKGHTQMECDSVHSCIERKLKNREVYLPSQYAQIASEARSKPFPYEQKQVFYDFFKDFKQNMRYNSIKPSRTAVVTDIKCIKYQDGKIMVKLSHGDDDEVPYEELATRPRVVLSNYTFPNLHSQQLAIKKTKFQHIQELKEYIPRDCHAYYDNLPHKD